MRRFYHCFCLLIAMAGLYAQYPGWTNYTYGREARGVFCDADYAWIASSGGLVRVNRATLETEYLTKANFNLPTSDLAQVARDSIGNLWVLPRWSNTLYRYDGSNWDTFTCPGAGAFTNFAVRGPNDIWLGSEFAGLYHFDGFVFTQDAWFGSPYTYYQTVHGVSCDSLGRIWFGVALSIVEQWQYNAVICYDGTQFTLFNPGGNVTYPSPITHIAFDAQNTLWAGTQGGGLWRYDGVVWTHFTTSNSGLANNSVTALCLDPWGSVWVGTNLGVDCFDGSSWQHFDTGNSSLPSNSVQDIAFDSEGTGWFATLNNLARWQNGTCQLISTSNSGLSYIYCKNQVRETTGTHWFASFGGLDWFDGQDWGHVDLPGQNDILNDLEFDSQGRLWLATQSQGLLCYTNDGFTIFNPDNSAIPDLSVYKLAIDSLDRIWMGFSNYGIACLDGAEITAYNQNNSPLPYGRITALEVDSQNRIWVGLKDGSYQSGSWLAVLEDNVWTIYNSANSGLPGYYINDIEIRDGIAWIATNQGLARFEGTNWDVWTPNNSGLPSNAVMAIAFGRNGHLLAGTTQGLAHYANGDWTVWDTSNSGIAQNTCPYLYVSPNDQIWIGSYDYGISVYEHGVSGTNDPSAVPVARAMKVSPNPFSSEVSISGLDIRQKREISIYNLRGQKLADWTFPAGNEARLNLSAKGLYDIPAGVYLFKVKSGSELIFGKALKVQ